VLPGGGLRLRGLEPHLARALRAAAARAHVDNVVVLEGAEKATNLPDACCDAIFIRDVYHHFTDPASMNRSLAASLEPGGRLAIIDFVPRARSELPNGVPANRGGHGIHADTVIEEVTAAGFTKLQTIDRWDDSDGMFLVLFEKR
jgi:SAM-dependent methyltransferase